jgi:hypothetical protein
MCARAGSGAALEATAGGGKGGEAVRGRGQTHVRTDGELRDHSDQQKLVGANFTALEPDSTCIIITAFDGHLASACRIGRSGRTHISVTDPM